MKILRLSKGLKSPNLKLGRIIEAALHLFVKQITPFYASINPYFTPGKTILV